MPSTSLISIRETARKDPHRIALNDGVESWTYRELYDKAKEYGAKMLGSRHKTFYVYAGNDMRTIAAIYGAGLAGKLVLVIPDFVPRPLAQAIRLQYGARVNAFTKTGYIAYDFPGGGGMVSFTSGSTGRPKAVVQTDTMLCTRWDYLTDPVHITERTSAFTGAPTTAAPSTYLMLLSIGATVNFLRETRPTPEQILDGYLESGANSLFVTPTVLNRLDLTEFRDLELIVSASMPFPDDLADRMPSNIPVMDVYATSETGGIGYRDVTKDVAFKLFDQVELEVLDGYGSVAAARPTTHTARGFLTRKGVVPMPFPYTTGDFAEFKDGKIYNVTRDAGRVKVAGFAISLDVIEEAAKKVPGVESVAFSVERGERSDAVDMRLNPGADAAKVRTALEQELPWYYVPRSIDA
jgi:acyl-coenzyme A synthetase/AMP-(fatty) acid ligase